MLSKHDNAVYYHVISVVVVAGDDDVFRLLSKYLLIPLTNTTTVIYLSVLHISFSLHTKMLIVAIFGTKRYYDLILFDIQNTPYTVIPRDILEKNRDTISRPKSSETLTASDCCDSCNKRM